MRCRLIRKEDSRGLGTHTASRALAERTGLSLPTIQRMAASGGVVRGNVNSLMKLIEGLEEAGIVLIGEGATGSVGGCGVRLK